MSTINGIMSKVTDVMQDKVSIQIGSYRGQTVYYNLMINQSLLGHHTFSFTWRIGDVVMDFKSQADFIRQYMGAKVIITFKDDARGENIYFKGIISQMEVLDNDGASKGFHIIGESPTILLDEIKQSETHFEHTLEEIAKKVDQNIVKGIITGLDIKPNYKNAIPYVVQYAETDFQFLQRLAIQYGEWMYYDGDYLKFGELKSSKAKLNNGINLHHFKVTSRLKSQKVSYKGYDYNSASEVASQNLEPQNNTQSYIAQNAQQASKSIFNRNNANHAFVTNATDASDIERIQNLTQQAGEANVLTYSGLSKIPLQIGGTVSIVKDKIEGTFVVTHLQHFSKGFGHYECQFESIPSEVKVPPYTNPHYFPKAETQGAVVTDNNDPSGMGRIKVNFFWGHESDWMRLVTPHAGSGKGFYFIPEIGEEVFVAFEGGNPEKPFVLGTQYNGRETSGYNTPGNDIKAIHTRSGHIIKFTEDESIVITDKSGNLIHFDTVGSNITITAPETMTLNCKNMNINVGENMTTQVGMDKIDGIGMNATETVGLIKNSFVNKDFLVNVNGSMTEMIKGNKESESKELKEVSKKAVLSSVGATIQINASKSLNKHSGEKSKSS